MFKLAAIGVVIGAVVSMSGAQSGSIDRALGQHVSVHFRDISVAGAMDFLAIHGINVAARTSDINVKEQVTLSVSSATMHDVMQALAGALGAHWTRSGNIFVLSRASTSVPTNWQLAGPFSRHFRSPDSPSGPDESAFENLPDDTTPSAVVTDEATPSVRAGSVASTKHSYLVRLTADGEWAVAEQWTSTSKTVAHSLRPFLSKRQLGILAKKGHLSLSDLTSSQTESLGRVWPDGKYHALNRGRPVVVTP